jgi:hypothetical protein
MKIVFAGDRTYVPWAVPVRCDEFDLAPRGCDPGGCIDDRWDLS